MQVSPVRFGGIYNIKSIILDGQDVVVAREKHELLEQYAALIHRDTVRTHPAVKLDGEYPSTVTPLLSNTVLLKDDARGASYKNFLKALKIEHGDKDPLYVPQSYETVRQTYLKRRAKNATLQVTSGTSDPSKKMFTILA